MANDINPIREAIQVASQREWDNFFDSKEREENQTMGQLDEFELTALQGRVNMIRKLKNDFQIMRQNK